METANEMKAKIVGKANQDEEFRSLLLDRPKDAIQQELGVAIPASMSVEVHEDSATTAHLVLPPGSRLSEPEMEKAVAGTGVMGDIGIIWRVQDW